MMTQMVDILPLSIYLLPTYQHLRRHCKNKLVTTLIKGVIEVSYVVIVVLKPKVIFSLKYIDCMKIENKISFEHSLLPGGIFKWDIFTGRIF